MAGSELSEKQAEYLVTVVTESTEARKRLDEIDRLLTDPAEISADIIRDLVLEIVGHGNFLRKSLRKLEAAVRTTEATRYIELKLEKEEAGDKFTDGALKTEASKYIGPIRKTRNLFQGYVESADASLSVCRMVLSSEDRS